MTNANTHGSVGFFGAGGAKHAVVNKQVSNYRVDLYDNTQFIGCYVCESESQAEELATQYAFDGKAPDQQLLNG